MIELFWACLIGGAMFTLVQLIFGDMFDAGGDVDVHGAEGLDAAGHLDGPGALDSPDGPHVSFFNGTTIVSAVSVFGGVGILLHLFAGVASLPAAALAAGVALLLAVAMHFLWIKPLRQGETSVAYSINECVGRIAEVTIPIPEAGHGEVMINFGGTNTVQIAASCEPGRAIPVGERVVVVEVKDQTLYVAAYAD